MHGEVGVLADLGAEVEAVELDTVGVGPVVAAQHCAPRQQPPRPAAHRRHRLSHRERLGHGVVPARLRRCRCCCSSPRRGALGPPRGLVAAHHVPVPPERLALAPEKPGAQAAGTAKRTPHRAPLDAVQGGRPVGSIAAEVSQAARRERCVKVRVVEEISVHCRVEPLS